MAAGISKIGNRESDAFYGGDGDDDFYGGGGRDTLSGGGGNDLLRSGATWVPLTGSWDHDDLGDTLDGGAGNDELNGGAASDLLLGGTGDDRLIGFGGADTLIGGDGNDFLDSGWIWDYRNQVGVPDTVGDLLEGGTGDDTLHGNDGNDTLDGGAGEDMLDGGAGDDTLKGGTGDDTLHGNDGNDTLDGGSGSNTLNGGNGNDTYVIRSQADKIWDSGGTDQGVVHTDWFLTQPDIEQWTWAAGVERLPYWIQALADIGPADRLAGDTRVKYYHFAEQPASFFSDEDKRDFTPFNASQRAYTKKVLDYMSTVIDIEFRETTNAEADDVVVMANNTQFGTSGYASNRLLMLNGQDDFNLAQSDRNPGVLVMLHELGHTLGLGHPHDDHGSDNDLLDEQEDRTAHTLMSYVSDWHDYRLFYSPLDIAALQYVYGPAAGAFAGDTVHLLDATRSNMLWDGSGHDLLDGSALTSDLHIDLRPGYWGDLGTRTGSIIGAGQVTINFGTVIENLTGGSGNDTLTGNDVDNILRGGAGNDTLSGGAGSDTLEGQAGLDIASYSGKTASFQVRIGAGSTQVSNSATPGELDTLLGVERLRFDDAWLALDIDGVAGQAYRLYQAAFDRTPDAGGLGYWIDRMDHGISLDSVAAAFMGSPEWLSTYGPAPSNRDLLSKLYQNILGREPDQGGFDFWLGHLDQGKVSAVSLLTQFSESAENQEAVIDIIGGGIPFMPA